MAGGQAGQIMSQGAAGHLAAGNQQQMAGIQNILQTLLQGNIQSRAQNIQLKAEAQAQSNEMKVRQAMHEAEMLFKEQEASRDRASQTANASLERAAGERQFQADLAFKRRESKRAEEQFEQTHGLNARRVVAEEQRADALTKLQETQATVALAHQTLSEEEAKRHQDQWQFAFDEKKRVNNAQIDWITARADNLRSDYTQYTQALTQRKLFLQVQKAQAEAEGAEAVQLSDYMVGLSKAQQQNYDLINTALKYDMHSSSPMFGGMSLKDVLDDLGAGGVQARQRMERLFDAVFGQNKGKSELDRCIQNIRETQAEIIRVGGLYQEAGRNMFPLPELPTPEPPPGVAPSPTVSPSPSPTAQVNGDAVSRMYNR